MSARVSLHGCARTGCGAVAGSCTGRAAVRVLAFSSRRCSEVLLVYSWVCDGVYVRWWASARVSAPRGVSHAMSAAGTCLPGSVCIGCCGAGPGGWEAIPAASVGASSLPSPVSAC